MSWGQYWVRNMFFRSLRTSFHNFWPPNPTTWTLKKSRFLVKNPIFCDFDDFLNFRFYKPQIGGSGQKCVFMAQICSLDVLDTCKYHGYIPMILRRTLEKSKKSAFHHFWYLEASKGKISKKWWKSRFFRIFSKSL